MKSFCIKTNITNIINFLIEDFSKLNLENLYISSNSFKIYDNVILHYKGDDNSLFFDCLCNTLTKTILKFYEPLILKKELNKNFFYFSDFEKARILELYHDENIKNTEDSLSNTFDCVYNSFSNYIQEGHHSLVLDGFKNFRLSNYHKIIYDMLENCVNRFLIEREYYEFINLLKLYINSNVPKVDKLHLIYLRNNSILLDEHRKIIDIKCSEALNAKFLSDITFSDNDYVLNYLLNTLPHQLIIHISNISYLQDEFLNTLKLIFEDRISIRTDCDITSL